MRHRSPTKPRRRWLFWTLTACALATPILLAAAWLALHHVPTWYQPAHVPDARLNDVRAGAAGMYNAISEGVVQGRAFHVRLDEREVTEWIAAAGRVWPGAADLVPPWLEDPVVRFQDGCITLGARLYSEGKELIVGVHLGVEIAEDMVTLRLTRLTGGSMPVPVGWLAAPISSLLRMEHQDVDLLPTPVADLVRKFRESEPLRLLSDGVPRANRFIWENGRRPFRLVGAVAREGALTLTIEPL